MFNDFMMFVAPGLTIIAAVILSFFIAKHDDAIQDENE